MRIIIAGGGTGGHLFPAVAVAEEIKRERPQAEVLLAGSSAGMEARWLPGRGLDFELLKLHGVRGHGVAARMRASLEFVRAAGLAMGMVRRRRPDVILCVGGYASAPLGTAAILRRVPLVLQEQNTLLGLTNRMLWRFASKVCVAFEETKAALKSPRVEVTGNPTRFKFRPESRKAGGGGMGLQILVLGGSSGAHRLNIGVVNAFKNWRKSVIKLTLTHQTGEADEEQVRAAYSELGVGARTVGFIDDMAAALEAADLVIARAGGNTVNEIALAGRAAIFVPYPFHRDMQQMRNARVLERAGGAMVIADDDRLAHNLRAAIERLARQPEEIEKMGERARTVMKPDAAARIASICFELSGEVR